MGSNVNALFPVLTCRYIEEWIKSRILEIILQINTISISRRYFTCFRFLICGIGIPLFAIVTIISFKLIP
jgi:hypothetical protein